MPITMDEAVLTLRRDPQFTDFIRDAYLEDDLQTCAERFRQSGEFYEVQRILGTHSTGIILDLGAGNGIASYAFCVAGAHLVHALEPDPSDLVGRGAIRRLAEGRSINLIDAYGELIPLADSTVDVVYARQVLHHTRQPAKVLQECARVLKSGGIFLACREHVVDNPDQLETFLKQHPIHQLVGNENAHSLDTYLEAIRLSGLNLTSLLGPWDSVINAFPGVRTQAELADYPRELLTQRFGRLGQWGASLPPIRQFIWKRLTRSVPGRMYTFEATKS
jgi:SAM-dependent methyltransferase